MRSYLFHKAKYFIEKNQVLVVPNGETEHSITLACGDHEVRIFLRNYRTEFSCNCKASANMRLCSHVIASLSLLATNPNLIGGNK